MRPARISGATRTLAPPPNWNQEVHGPCRSLAVRDVQITEGERVYNRMTSAWEPMPEELGWMLAGGDVHFSTPGSSHPPIDLAGQLPPEDSPPAIIARPFMRDGEDWVRVEIYQPARSEPRTPAGWTWHEEALRGNGLAMTTAVAIEGCEAVLAKLRFAPGGETA